jgi:hypothetical protein
MTRSLKRGIAAISLAAALSTVGPAASSFFAFSSFQPPARGGMSVVHKTAIVPDWLAEISASQALKNQSAMADETRLKTAEAPI